MKSQVGRAVDFGLEPPSRLNTPPYFPSLFTRAHKFTSSPRRPVHRELGLPSPRRPGSSVRGYLPSNLPPGTLSRRAPHLPKFTSTGSSERGDVGSWAELEPGGQKNQMQGMGKFEQTQQAISNRPSGELSWKFRRTDFYPALPAEKSKACQKPCMNERLLELSKAPGPRIAVDSPAPGNESPEPHRMQIALR